VKRGECQVKSLLAANKQEFSRRGILSRIWRIVVVWGAGLCRIGGVGGLGEAGRVGGFRIMLRGQDGERRS